MLIIAHRDTTINQAERRIYLENGQLIKDDATISVSQSEGESLEMKPHIHFRIDKDLILAILVGVLGGLVALAMFFLSGYMVTQSALGAPYMP